MKFYGMVNGKIFDNAVEFYLSAISGEENVPQEALDEIKSRLSEDEKKKLAVLNWDYWMEYTGLKIGDKINCYQDNTPSVFNPMLIGDRGLIDSKTRNFLPHWEHDLIMYDDRSFEKIEKLHSWVRAFEHLKNGGKIRRSSWANKNYHIFMRGYRVIDKYGLTIEIIEFVGTNDWILF